MCFVFFMMFKNHINHISGEGPGAGRRSRVPFVFFEGANVWICGYCATYIGYILDIYWICIHIIYIYWIYIYIYILDMYIYIYTYIA